MFQFLIAAATLVVHPQAVGEARTPAPGSPSATEVVAPCEYNWTFSYREHIYGIQQYGPVAIYRRNTLLIWRNQAHLLPVSVPWVVAIVAVAVVFPLAYFFAMAFVRESDSPVPTVKIYSPPTINKSGD